MTQDNISFFVAFAAGLLSILSPCVLPLLPSYVSYITGISFDELTSAVSVVDSRFRGNDRGARAVFKTTLRHSLFFIFGFSFVFIFLGASASFLGGLLNQYQDLITKIGGGILIIFGLHLVGVMKLGFLEKEKKADFKTKPTGLLGSFIVGVIFAAAWTPCVGPILGGILTLAATQGNVGYGVYLLTAYSIGFALPFLLFSLFLNSFLFHFQNFKKHIHWVSVLSGILLLVLGVTLITGHFTSLAGYLSRFNFINF
ncbi:MAG: sulfite exporter TauE/SafE family protein [Deltaproteobacteria bacterium]|nr:sulfite exporter TauE/SafE family protein [Deltaproteobacteria bacterium]